MLAIHCPDSCRNEREYILSWVFGEVFGLPYEATFEAREDWRIEETGSGMHVDLDDSFFRRIQDCWLEESSLEDATVRQVDADDLGCDLLSESDGELPVIWGSETADNSWSELTPAGLRLGVDILGSLFFLLSRYEEAVIRDRDEHDRFPAAASLTGGQDWLARPVGNVYIEVLWNAMKRIWPGLQRKQREFRLLPSHDVDLPSFYGTARARQILRRAARTLRKGKAGAAAGMIKGWLANRMGYGKSDPYDTVDTILDLSEQAGVKSSFYYIPEKTSPLDRSPSITHRQVEGQWKRIAARGHEIGMHPGYETYHRSERIRSGAERIREQLQKLGIAQPLQGGRHHFLRWRTPSTARAWDDAGLAYDSTLGYAEHPGFRCGVCYEYPLYDLEERRPLRLRERPLVAMECSVIDERYLNLGSGAEAFDVFRSLKEECRKYRGDFTLLWHNHRLADPGEKDLYHSVLEA